jgi:acyl phosphate:glycerol-3-phosphate acyltransferase
MSCVGSFLTGGIPFGFLVGRYVLKDDIRNHGSGNIGATNVGRVVGWNWGGLVLLLDALKGFVPTGLTLFVAKTHLPEVWVMHTAVAAGMSSILGHMYPIYLQLRGGKGVATALGVVLVLAPESMLIALPCFVLILAITRRMALASITAALAFGISYLILAGSSIWELHKGSLTAFAICIPALIIWRHRTNISRLFAGTEPTISQRVAPQANSTPAADQLADTSGPSDA